MNLTHVSNFSFQNHWGQKPSSLVNRLTIKVDSPFLSNNLRFQKNLESSIVFMVAWTEVSNELSTRMPSLFRLVTISPSCSARNLATLDQHNSQGWRKILWCVTRVSTISSLADSSCSLVFQSCIGLLSLPAERAPGSASFCSAPSPSALPSFCAETSQTHWKGMDKLGLKAVSVRARGAIRWSCKDACEMIGS